MSPLHTKNLDDVAAINVSYQTHRNYICHIHLQFNSARIRQPSSLFSSQKHFRSNRREESEILNSQIKQQLNAPSTAQLEVLLLSVAESREKNFGETRRRTESERLNLRGDSKLELSARRERERRREFAGDGKARRSAVRGSSILETAFSLSETRPTVGALSERRRGETDREMRENRREREREGRQRMEKEGDGGGGGEREKATSTSPHTCRIATSAYAYGVYTRARQGGG